ncbi:facilitated trehalose transporter Tret1-like [Diachasma alloeum]|uniref:facilitated trehalose transporter Tret1-like n=1 Tax=Diachasma alloeum TaxID=454923 RepID=UPI000738230D|nr:facilitated trehalose transporter Tret1-like [Diachasma alloeum]
MSTTETSKTKKTRVWSQWLAASTIHLLAILDGLVCGWVSPYLAKLTAGTESLKITNDEASWIASLSRVSQLLGSILAAVIVYKIGAKKAVFFAGVPYVIGWSCFLIQESVLSIYIARIINGFAIGMFLSTFPLYIGEISKPKIRGALISAIAQGAGIGSLLGNCLGAYLPMTTFAIIGLIMSIVFLLSFYLIPDSSHYLVKRNKLKEAEKSLKWYNRQKDVGDELGALIAYIGKPQKLSRKEAFKQILIPLNRKLLIIILCILVFTNLSGVFVIQMYMEILLTALKIKIISPSLVVICVGIVAIISGLLTMYTNDHFGRRTMLAVSALGVSVTFFLIGAKFLLVNRGYDISSVQWLIIAEFMIYIFFVNVGIVNIPYCLLSEIFPTEFKEIGASTANVVSSIAAFVAGKSYQSVLDATSEEFIFFFYGSILFFMFIYTILVVPETKGKSLQEIQNMFTQKNKRMSNSRNDSLIATSPR